MCWTSRVLDPHVAAARRVAGELLEPEAQRADDDGVPASHVEALEAAGLLGVTAPEEYGGGGASLAVGREVTEVLAGACGATWFVATQHGSPLKTLLRSDNEDLRGRWLRPLASSRALAGGAVSHLRRPGAPMAATPVDEGWRLDGRVDWMTSWGLADVFLLGGVHAADADAVLALVPARDQPGLAASAPLRLAAMQGARNVSLTLDGFVVRHVDVALVQPLEQWRAADRLVTANVTPAVFGLLCTILGRLRDVVERRGSDEGRSLVAGLTAESAELRQRAYVLLDDVPAEERLDERLAVRAHALELLNRAAVGLVAAGAGMSMLAGNPAQRLAREALFHLIQAQTPPVREATLRRLGEQTRPV